MKKRKKTEMDTAICNFDFDKVDKLIKEQNEDSEKKLSLREAHSQLLTSVKLHRLLYKENETEQVREKRRNFCQHFRIYCKEKNFQDLYVEWGLLESVDKIYSEILHCLKDEELYKAGICTALSNVIISIVNTYNYIDKKLHANPSLKDVASGGCAILDELSDNLCTALSYVIKVMAYNFNLIKDKECIVLPEEIFVQQDATVSEETVYSFVKLCELWIMTNEICERFRYLGDKAAIYDFSSNGSAKFKIDCEKSCRFSFYYFIAKQRLRNIERLIIVEYSSRALKEDAMKRYIRDYLSVMFGYDVSKVCICKNDLTVQDMIDGYCLLYKLANESYGKCGSFYGAFNIYPYDDLKLLFSKQGFSENAFNTFILLMTFKKQDQDLFDAPLIKTSKGNYVLFTPSFIYGSSVQTLTSRLALYFDVAHKGELFEKEVLKFFQDNGYNAKSVQFKIGKNEYQYDVIVEWDEYVFIIECKNFFLPYTPFYAAGFLAKMDAAVKQVLRLKEAAQNNSNIFGKKTGISINGKIVFPCILNALPYWQPEKEGVVFIDFVFLKQFFNKKFYEEVISGGNEKEVQQSEPLWSGDEPTVKDFLKHIELPVPVRNLIYHTRRKCESVENKLMRINMDKWELY